MHTERGSSKWRRALEIGFWPLIIGLFWTLDTLTKIDQRQRAGTGLDDFRLITEQVTSALGVCVMVVFVAFWLRQFPLDRSRPLPTLVGHIVGSVLFTLGHYVLLVLFRKLVFGLNGMQYMPDQWHLPNLVFEYKKDVRIYLIIVAIIATYRYLRDRSETEERLPEGEGGVEPVFPPKDMSPPKLAVQAPRGELLLDVEDIDYLEAARNYVAVYSDGQEYLVRSPLTTLIERLPEERFLRTHRSYVVNVARVAGRNSTEAGHQLVLGNGVEIPVSRGYRNVVDERLSRLQL